MYCPLYTVHYTLDTVSQIGIGRYTRDEWMDVGGTSRSPDLHISTYKSIYLYIHLSLSERQCTVYSVQCTVYNIYIYTSIYLSMRR